MAFWACRLCTAYSQGITRKVKQVEVKVDQLADSVEEVRGSVKEAKEELAKVNEKMNKVEEKVVQATERGSDQVFEELRDREARRLNLVLHGVPECEQEAATGRERQSWDKEQCLKLCQAQGLDYDSETIKFCRRVGAVGDGPRPLVVGFFTDMERSMVLRRVSRLEGTDYSEVKIAPDLTKRQRREERDLWEEQENRNKNRTEEQIQKNLVWAVVGARGEKRLIMQPARSGPQQMRGRARGRGRPPATGPGRPPNNPGSSVRGRGGAGARGGARQAARSASQLGESPRQAEEMDSAPEMETEQLAPGQKRKAAAGPEGQPQEKR